MPRWRKVAISARGSIPAPSRSAVRFAVRIASLPQRLTHHAKSRVPNVTRMGDHDFAVHPVHPILQTPTFSPRLDFVVLVHDTLLWGAPPRFDVLHAGGDVSVAPAPLSGDRRGRDGQFVSAIVTYCFVTLSLPRSSSARRISRVVGGTEDNIETRCSFVHGRSPAPAKAGDHVKSRRTIVRNQFVASGT